MFNYSSNMLKTYLDCPKKFYFRYVEKINSPTSVEPFEKGKKIHALANYYLKGVNISRIETSLSKEEINLWNLLKENEYYSKEYLFSEFPISVKIADYWIGGRIDALVKDKENYYILDYKTGAIPKNPEFDPQTMVYLLAMDKYLQDYGSLSFVYIDLKNNINHKIDFNQELKKKYSDSITELCKKIEKTTIFDCNTNKCDYCEFKNFCNN